jgi:deoxyribodipyrimidine photo-lyase
VKDPPRVPPPASDSTLSIVWFRRDLRLHDHAALTAAASAGAVLPVFILDPETEALGAAPKWRLGEALAALGETLRAAGSRLILRRGPALAVLSRLAEETGARSVHWTRLYDPVPKARDIAVKAGLKAAGIAATSHPGHVLFEPMDVLTGQGGFYRVYTPFWKAVEARAVGAPLPPPVLRAPAAWPACDRLSDWPLAAAMNRGAAVLARHAVVGEARAMDRLAAFVASRIAAYKDDRDALDGDATSGLSENLALGEISPRVCWHAGQRAMHEGARGAGHFLKELVWREFAHHLAHHTPHMLTGNWREGWDAFPWRDDNPDAERWRRGLTGEPLIDAAMREMYVTGRMHNRARMLVASYLTKHLMTHWKVGLDWFADCLIDWDPASNAMGWQWTAGSGPDAAPYFRVFNPALQAEKFDTSGNYRSRFLHGFRPGPQHPDALAFFDAVPRSWGLAPGMAYPAPLIDLMDGRDRALAAYQAHARVA